MLLLFVGLEVLEAVVLVVLAAVFILFIGFVIFTGWLLVVDGFCGVGVFLGGVDVDAGSTNVSD